MNHCLFFERLGLLESFRRPWVCCKRSFYWGFELSHRMKSETHYPFVPMYYSLVLLKTLFLSLVPLTTMLYFPKKQKSWLTPQTWCSGRFLRRTSLFCFRAEYYYYTQTGPKKQKSGPSGCLLWVDKARAKDKTYLVQKWRASGREFWFSKE